MGLVSLAWGFAKSHWKIIALVLGGIALIHFHQNRVAAYGDARYRSGVEATIAKMKKEVARRNDENRALEADIQAGIDAFADTKSAEAEKRRAEEQKHINRIDRVVETVVMWKSQECSVTQQVLDDRNAIRNLGPEGAPQ